MKLKMMISFDNDNYVVIVEKMNRLMLFGDIMWSNEWVKRQRICVF